MNKLFWLILTALVFSCATTQSADEPRNDNLRQADDMSAENKAIDELTAEQDKEMLENAEKMAKRIKENLEAMDKDLERVQKYAGSQPSSVPIPDEDGDVWMLEK